MSALLKIDSSVQSAMMICLNVFFKGVKRENLKMKGGRFQISSPQTSHKITPKNSPTPKKTAAKGKTQIPNSPTQKSPSRQTIQNNRQMSQGFYGNQMPAGSSPNLIESREELISRYEYLADQYAAALEEREELKKQKNDLAREVASIHKQQERLEELLKQVKQEKSKKPLHDPE